MYNSENMKYITRHTHFIFPPEDPTAASAMSLIFLSWSRGCSYGLEDPSSTPSVLSFAQRMEKPLGEHFMGNRKPEPPL